MKIEEISFERLVSFLFHDEWKDQRKNKKMTLIINKTVEIIKM